MAHASVVNVPNIPVMDVADIEPPDMIAVVKLPYVEVMLPDVIVLVVRVDANLPVPLTSSMLDGLVIFTPTYDPVVGIKAMLDPFNCKGSQTEPSEATDSIVEEVPLIFILKAEIVLEFPVVLSFIHNAAFG